MRFALYQPSLAPLPAEALARALACVPRLSAAQPAQLARDAYGVALDGLSRQEADAAAEALAECGVRVGPQAFLEPVARAVVRRGRLEPDAFVALDPYGRETRVAYADVLLLACGELPEDAPAPPSAGEPRAIERPADLMAALLAPPEAPDGRTRALLELVTKSPVRRFRIEASGFDYGCLGTRKQPSTARNFRALLEELAQRTVAAQHNQGATALLVRGESLRYAGERPFEREIGYWLWKLHDGDAARFAREEPTATAPALDPLLLGTAPRARLGRSRTYPRLARTIAPVIAVAVLAWLLVLLNRLASTGFAPPP